MYVQTMFHFSHVVWRVSRIFQFSEACQASGNATWMTNTDYSVRAFIHLQIYGIFYKWRDFHRKNLHFSFFKMIHKAFSRFEKREAGSKEREHWGITAQRRREQDCWRRKEQHCWRRRKQGCARSVVDRRRRENYPTKEKPPCRDMEALKISVKMKIFFSQLLRRAFQDKHLLHRAFQTWQQLPDDPQDKSRRTT